MALESINFSVPDMIGNHSEKEIKRGLDTLRGVRSVSVNLVSKNVAVDYDTTAVSKESIERKLSALGYTGSFWQPPF